MLKENEPIHISQLELSWVTIQIHFQYHIIKYNKMVIEFDTMYITWKIWFTERVWKLIDTTNRANYVSRHVRQLGLPPRRCHQPTKPKEDIDT